MSDTEYYWFHCGRCGSLFQGEVDHSDERVCANCGEHPAPSIDEAYESTPERPITVPMMAAGKVRARPKRSYRKLLIFLKIVAAWLVFIGLIVAGAHWLWGDDPVTKNPPPIVKGDDSDKEKDEDSLYLGEVLPQCLDALVGYIKAKSVEEQMPHLMTGGLSAELIEAYEKEALLADIDADTIRLKGSARLQLEGREAVMTHWQTEMGDLFDAVFFNIDGEWKLDWQHFVRYGTNPWTLFLAGTGEDEGVFRLLARERYGEKRDVANEIEVVLYASRHGRMAEAGFKAVMNPVSLDDHGGKMLAAGFDHARDGVPFFGSRISRVNPDEMIRVRVKVKRVSGDGPVYYEVTDVLNCHWLGIDQQWVTLEGGEAEEDAAD